MTASRLLGTLLRDLVFWLGALILLAVVVVLPESWKVPVGVGAGLALTVLYVRHVTVRRIASGMTFDRTDIVSLFVAPSVHSPIAWKQVRAQVDGDSVVLTSFWRHRPVRRLDMAGASLQEERDPQAGRDRGLKTSLMHVLVYRLSDGELVALAVDKQLRGALVDWLAAAAHAPAGGS